MLLTVFFRGRRLELNVEMRYLSLLYLHTGTATNKRGTTTGGGMLVEPFGDSNDSRSISLSWPELVLENKQQVLLLQGQKVSCTTTETRSRILWILSHLSMTSCDDQS